jgi:tetratricopeptide (TPR) repeat protein
MKRIFLTLFLVGMLSAMGCHSLPERGAVKTFLYFGKRKPVVDTAPAELCRLDRARLLQRKKNYYEAIICYREILDTSKDRCESDMAKIGLGQCLIATAKYAAALKALEPLPLEVHSDLDAQKLAVAGEVLLCQRRWEEAETHLARAVG